MMKSIWITYSWVDNKDGDVDFAAQELIRAGLDIKLDRWNLSAGKRLWEQMGLRVVRGRSCRSHSSSG